MTINPMRNALMLYWAAKPSAIGAMMATAAGLAAPIAVKTAATANMIHGIAARCPLTPRTASWTSQSTVPLAWAMANRKVTPTSTTKMLPGNTPKMSSADNPAAKMPTRKAAANASAPMLMGSVVAMTKMTTRTRMEMSSIDIDSSSFGAVCECHLISLLLACAFATVGVDEQLTCILVRRRSLRCRRASWGTGFLCLADQEQRRVCAGVIYGHAPRLGKSILGEAGEYVAGWEPDEQADAELEEQGRGIVPADRMLDAPGKIVADLFGVAQRTATDVARVRDGGRVNANV